MRSLMLQAFRQVLIIVCCVLLLECFVEGKDAMRRGAENPIVYELGVEKTAEKEAVHYQNLKEMELSPVEFGIGFIGRVIFLKTGWQTREIVDFSTSLVLGLLMLGVIAVCFRMERRAMAQRLSMFGRRRIVPDESKQDRRKGISTIAMTPYNERSIIYTIVVVAMSLLGVITEHPVKIMLLCIVVLMLTELGYLLWKNYRGELPPNPTDKDLSGVYVKRNWWQRNYDGLIAWYEHRRAERDPEKRLIHVIARRIRGY